MLSRDVVKEKTKQLAGTDGHGVKVIKHEGGARMTIVAIADTMIMVGQDTFDIEDFLVEMKFSPDKLRDAADRIEGST